MFGAVAAISLLALSACSGGGGDGVASAGGEVNGPNPTGTSTPLDANAQALVYAQCVRDNGVNMPDPGPGRQGFIDAYRAVADDYDRATLQRALTACQNQLPQYPGEQEHGNDDSWMLDLAECLRDQGLDVSDNPFNDAHSGRIDVNEFSAAMEVCRDVLTGGGQ
jgi:hypothetical protein